MKFTDEIYDSWMKETQLKKYEGIYMDFLLPTADKMKLEEAKVLDIGVGKGWFERFLAEKGVEPELFVGVDSELRNTDAPFVLSDGNALPFESGVFDVVISLDTIHLIENVREFPRVVRRDGFLLISDFCNPRTMESKRAKMLRSFDDMRLLKEGVVGDEREMDYVALLQKV